ncbi:hypothetical protein EIP86_003921 [Pleurotus ostreatoroseus]|nr:hypothetical protein EIP86_003921 [Pleurotus ostreatoroseus]
MGGERKKAIYDICVEYDIIIVEDDPYYFLQEGEYKPKSERVNATVKHESDKFIASLAPSYLKFDYQGRVIRLDTFSKTIAPGSRMGWFTCSPLFAERLERQGETTTQAPCGFGQSLIGKLLTTWQYDGYVRWLHGLAVEYTARRDHFIDCIADEFHLQKAPSVAHGVWAGCDVFEAYEKPKGSQMTEKFATRTKYFSFVPPTSGMFIWIKMSFESMPSFKEGDEETLEMQLWEKIAEAGVLMAPGWYFSATDIDSGEGHYRISFSQAEFPVMKKAVTIFGEVVREFFKQ